MKKIATLSLFAIIASFAITTAAEAGLFGSVVGRITSHFTGARHSAQR